MITHEFPWPQGKPRLDWAPRHDPRSLAYGIGPIVAGVEEKVKMWAPGVVLDQGAEGACVGFGWTGELLASPRPDAVLASVGNAFARSVYSRAKEIDEYEGVDYEGTSVLAGAKTIVEHGYMDGYRWAFDIEEVRGAVITQGPVVIGIPWYEEMYYTRPSGLVKVGGPLVGGHCILLTGYHPAMRIRGENYNERFRVFRWRNSWGPGYGDHGSGYVRYEDLRDLLKWWGESCIPVGRKIVRL